MKRAYLGHAISNAIQKALAIASGPDADWQQLVVQGEWIGINFEQEPDRANAQQIQDRDHARAATIFVLSSILNVRI
jgi:hypothetical protein